MIDVIKLLRTNFKVLTDNIMGARRDKARWWRDLSSLTRALGACESDARA